MGVTLLVSSWVFYPLGACKLVAFTQRSDILADSHASALWKPCLAKRTVVGFTDSKHFTVR
jgi:hypothetical protein